MDFFNAAADDLKRMGWGRWDDDSPLWLCPKKQFDLLPDGIALHSISGKVAVKGRDYIDDDTRSGMLAYGIIPGKTTTQVTATDVATANAAAAAATAALIERVVHEDGLFDLSTGDFLTGDDAVAALRARRAEA